MTSMIVAEIHFAAFAKMEKERRCGWESLPVEIQDVILRMVVGRSGDPNEVMAVVLPFVCRAWRERKPFWSSFGSAAGQRGPWTSHAAALGNLPLLKWLRENRCPWDKDSCINASDYGHYEIFEWLRENGCPCPFFRPF